MIFIIPINNLKYSSTIVCKLAFPKLQLSCLGLYTHRKVHTKSGCNPSFKLSIIFLLAGNVSINPGPKTFQSMRFTTTNLRYVHHKYVALSDLMLSKDTYILALTQTWLSASETPACLANICPYDMAFVYTIFCLYRYSGRGGGVVFLLPESYKVEIIHTPQY